MPRQLNRIIELVNQSDFIVTDLRCGEMGRICKEASEELIPHLRGTIGEGHLACRVKVVSLCDSQMVHLPILQHLVNGFACFPRSASSSGVSDGHEHDRNQLFAQFELPNNAL